jgi:hypothetical protein
MNVLELYIAVVGMITLLAHTAYKYNLDIAYEEWVSRKNIKLLPQKFCLQCFATQSTLIVSTIIVPLLGLPLYLIIILTLSIAPYTIFLINR